MSSKPAENVSAEKLLTQLASEGLIDEQGRADFQRLAMERQSEKEPPLFLRVLLSLGAFLSTIFLVGFLFAAKLIADANGVGMIVWGAVFMAAAVGLYRLGARGGGVGRAWRLQLSFSAMLTGKALVLMGAANSFIPHYDPRETWMLAYIAAAVTIVAYPVFPVSVDRFLSAFVALMLTFSAILGDEMRGRIPGTALTVWFIAQLIAVAVYMTWSRVQRVHLPVAYALICSLCVIVAFWGAHSQIFYWSGPSSAYYAPQTAAGTVALALALMGLIGWAAGGVDKLKNEPLALACVGAALLATLSAPGVLLAIGLMILGYARRDHLLLVGGAVLLPAFISLYYYNLDLDFVSKSGVLVGSGAVLLGGRAYMYFRGWDVEA